MNKKETLVFAVGTLLIVGFIGFIFTITLNPKKQNYTTTPVVVDSSVFIHLNNLNENDSIIINNQKQIDKKLDNVRSIRVFKVKKILNDTVTLKPLE